MSQPTHSNDAGALPYRHTAGSTVCDDEHGTAAGPVRAGAVTVGRPRLRPSRSAADHGGDELGAAQLILCVFHEKAGPCQVLIFSERQGILPPFSTSAGFALCH